MQNNFKIVFLALLFSVAGLGTSAQPDNVKTIKTDSVKTIKTYNVAIFSPLYLDSAFTGTAYRYGKGFPKFSLPGLDFIQGAQIALDSLPIPNINFNTRIYDSKSYFQTIASLISSKELDSMDMIIGSVKDLEYIQLAGFAKQKNIPFISATHPNDGGVTANPFMVIVNPTLKAHCESIYAHILQSHGADKIFLVRKPGTQENSVEEQFKKINAPDGKALIKIEIINTNGDFSVIRNKLDSNKKAVIIGGSLNEAFANELATYLQSISKTYKTTLIGMPNWDGFSSIVKNKKLKDFPIYYTSPFYNNKWDIHSRRIKETYLRKYKGIPSDLTYKGFEITYQFAQLLGTYPNDLSSHLNDYPSRIFSDYNFKPVFLTKNTTVPDYFENKNLYFVKILNGTSTKAW
ncbi:MAG: ABC transporter substrate-binding protein [Gloeobacteraceae cyanobacterium ES-bin-316]|nr:ABC transporter substrate-binding protein [Ferruginibacter sp.]